MRFIVCFYICVSHASIAASALTIGYVTGIQGAHENGTQKDTRFMQAGACCKHYVRAQGGNE